MKSNKYNINHGESSDSLPIEITPEIAQLFLDTQITGQRPIKLKNLKRLMRSAGKGMWNAGNGETIKFNQDLELIDGQHRCFMVAKTETSIFVLVVVFCNPKAFLIIDAGAPKVAADKLRVMGHKSAFTTAAALSLLWRYLYHCLGGNDDTPSHEEVWDLLSQHPGIEESVKVARECSHIMPHPKAAFLHYVCSLTNKDIANEFIETIATGRGSSQSRPNAFFILRETEIKFKGKKNQPVRFERYRLAIAIKAVNAYYQGQDIKLLKWANTEMFPVLLSRRDLTQQ